MAGNPQRFHRLVPEYEPKASPLHQIVRQDGSMLHGHSKIVQRYNMDSGAQESEDSTELAT
jgi:hypothetical protein